MPHAKIASHQAIHTLKQLHAELAGKILDNKREARRLRQSMVHVEAVIKLLAPAENIAPYCHPAPPAKSLVQARDHLAGSPGRATDGFRADDGAGDYGGNAEG